MNLLNISFNNLKTFTVLYIKKSLQKKKKKIKNFKKYFFLTMHKKLHYFSFIYDKKKYVLSAGRILKKTNKSIKFFKKSRKSIIVTIGILNRNLKKNFKRINFFLCNNFNYRNYLWIKKYIRMISPKIKYFILTNNWNYIVKQKRRLKKKILKNIVKNNKKLL